MPPNLWLIGMMGSGKTSVAHALADTLGMVSVDLDAEVSARTGCSIAHLWGTVGEQAFRDMEAAAIMRIAGGTAQVIATGGGAVMRPDNVARMRASGTVVWLRAAPAVLASRLGDRDATRPLLAEHDSAEAALTEILAQRAADYAGAADFQVDTDGLTVAEVAAELMAQAGARHRRIRAGEADVLIGADIVGRMDAVLPDSAGRRRVAILTQPNAEKVATRVAAALAGTGLDVATRILPDRDAAKTLTVVEEVAKWLNEQQFARRDTVVGVGGGALTDVAGFVAATYLRGVEAVLVPTTLLGAIDAAIGGKTAVNVGGKNLVGAFRHPSRVVVDTAVLGELPDALLREGSAEALKAGFIADIHIVELYERFGLEAPLADIVPRAIAVKAQVVNEDFTEQGTRAVLNYGHTIGHAVEIAAGTSHGEAVAVGMVAAGAASVVQLDFGELERHDAAIRQLGLPTAAPNVARRHVDRLLVLDKKRDESGLRMVLLRTIGDPIVVTVDSATVDAALRAVGIGQ